MNIDDYLSKYLDTSELPEEAKPEKSSRPDWAEPSKRSGKAYDAIESLKGQKKAFIKKHGKKSDYDLKGNYLITKKEVAALVGPNVKPQPLFFSKTTSYCEALLTHFNNANDELNASKEKRISKKGRGLMQKTKEELIEQLRAEKESKTEELTSLADDVYQRTLDNISLDMKRKLGLL